MAYGHNKQKNMYIYMRTSNFISAEDVQETRTEVRACFHIKPIPL